ncbi:malate synthase A [Sphingomicrobium sediminis]|uniref:malate synthase n=1 Tax=Sphingomicrobium sediminis TaxID=2950949 RepID=A0A9X2EIF5_9SPHN|nr:malate synthase A [Sphingomicrobium sediminis]MCM8558110.1 malate synthase A [Sphingomicrobium sediminis]
MSTVLEKPRAIARPSGVEGAAGILTPSALDLVAELHERFDARRRELLAARMARQERYNLGERPDFRADTTAIREADWKVGDIPPDLLDRKVEITGPTNAKMVINALNSGARVFMADFEDATAPAWDELVAGQRNLHDYWRGDLAFDDPKSGKSYRVGSDPAVLIARVRGLHLKEVHVTVDGTAVAGAFFDAALYLCHNAHAALARGSGPYLYLPKLETMEEAALWSDVIELIEDRLNLKRGTIKVTVLIETIDAAFQMDEILHALKANIVGLNCGRWDYIFSFIKRLGRTQEMLTPDRGAMTMDKAFLAAYAERLVATCHRRGAFAMGGMSAFIPVKGDEAANANAFAKVKADKDREVSIGHDGSWVAHPGLVPVAFEAFEKVEGKNQLHVMPETLPDREALLELHEGARTEEGVRDNIRVAVQYVAAWLGGRGAVPLCNLMEDAATAEIARAQLWQWLRYEAPICDERHLTRDLFEHWFQEEMLALGDTPHVAEAGRLVYELVTAKAFPEFLTLPAYEELVRVA